MPNATVANGFQSLKMIERPNLRSLVSRFDLLDPLPVGVGPVAGGSRGQIILFMAALVGLRSAPCRCAGSIIESWR
jgi:hypothetical protein